MKIKAKEMKWSGAFLLCSMLVLLFITEEVTAKTKVPVSSVAISNVKNKQLTVEKGTKHTLKTKIKPSNATTKTVKWKSSNTKVVSVSSKGKLTAKKKGTAKITATATDGSKKKTTITVTVVKRVKSITVTNRGNQVEVGKSFAIKTTISPSKASNTTLSYTSSNKEVATVSSTGIVKAVGVPTGKTSATATITIKSTDGGDVVTTYKVKVTKPTTNDSANDSTTKATQYFSHMGLNKEAPSNTLPAFELAAKSGAYVGLETDVQETKDGKFVLYHDENLSSRTNKSGVLTKLTLQEIRQATITKGSNISKYPNLKVPTIEEYLELCKKYQMRPILHIKNVTNYKTLIQIVKDAGLYEETIIMAGKSVLTKIRSIDSKVKLYWLCNLSKSGIDWAVANNIHVNSDYTYVTKELVDYAHRKGLEVGAWTVNSSSSVTKLKDMGVDYITTDYIFK